MNSITVKAPAKVNLFLKVLSKRKDSYHNILTLFERISLADTIKISGIPEGIIVKSDKPITKDPRDNLVYRAARAILKRGRVRPGVKIEIKKKIPIAAGLGGGSSDAASVLKGINKLFDLRLDVKTLISLGRSIGADVPFFILDTPFAAGKGIGDDITVIKTRKTLWHLLIYPGFKVNTKDVYKEFDGIKTAEPGYLTLRQGSGSSIELLSKYLTGKMSGVKISLPVLADYRGMEAMLYNDLERAAVSKKRAIGYISGSLAKLLGKKFIVSGSGPSLFCLCSTGKEAMRAKRAVLRRVPAKQRRGWLFFVVRTA